MTEGLIEVWSEHTGLRFTVTQHGHEHVVFYGI
jgi:hypothetical protein